MAVHGGRGKARPENQRAAWKAEAFEEALARVSARVAALARRSAADLRAQRLPGGPANPAARGSGPTPGCGRRRAASHWRACR